MVVGQEKWRTSFYIHKLYNSIPAVFSTLPAAPILFLFYLNLSPFKIMSQTFLYRFFPHLTKQSEALSSHHIQNILTQISFVVHHIDFLFILRQFQIYGKVARVIWRTFIYPLTTFTIFCIFATFVL